MTFNICLDNKIQYCDWYSSIALKRIGAPNVIGNTEALSPKHSQEIRQVSAATSLHIFESFNIGMVDVLEARKISLSLAALDLEEQRQLTRLTIFPSTFDEEDAAAILDNSTEFSNTQLQLFYKHGLLERDSPGGRYRWRTWAAQGAACMNVDKVQVVQARAAFVKLVIGWVKKASKQYFTPDFKKGTDTLRNNAENIAEMWRLVGDRGGLPYDSVQEMLAAVLQPPVYYTLAAARLLSKKALCKIAHSSAHFDFVSAAHNFFVISAERDSSDKLAKLQSLHEKVRSCHELPFLNLASHSQIACAACLVSMGQAEKAAAVYRLVMADQQRQQTPDYPITTLYCGSNLFSCLLFQGKLAEAKVEYHTLQKEQERVLGPDHPDTLSIIIKLATCLRGQGKPEGAEALYRIVVEKQKIALGPAHPDTLRSISKWATCLQGQGKLVDAEVLFSNVVKVRQLVLGHSHKDTISSTLKLIRCIKAQRKQADANADADNLYRTALEDCKRGLGHDHLSPLMMAASSLQAQLKLAETVAQSENAVQLQHNILDLGRDSLDSLAIRHSLASFLWCQGDVAAAEVLYRNVMEAQQRVLGPFHRKTTKTISNLAKCAHSQGKLGEAAALYQTALKGQEQVLGPNHLDSLATRQCLADCLGKPAAATMTLAIATSDSPDCTTSIRASCPGCHGLLGWYVFSSL
jgi:tetratricopeptide (TPR) repeat protein